MTLTRQINLFQDQLKNIEKWVPPKPYCTDVLSEGCARAPKKIALQKKYLQLNDRYQHALIVDLDYAGSFFAWEDCNVPPPNFIALNRANKRCHYVYSIVPVLTVNKTTNAMRLLRKTQLGLRRQLDGDIHFTDFLSKSLWSKKWETTLIEPYSYELRDIFSELSDDVLAQPETKAEIEYGVGRNCIVFDNTRQYSYRAVRKYRNFETFKDAIFQKARATNYKFSNPLHDSELHRIVKSISNWTWEKMTPESFADLQAHRGSLRGKKRKDDLLPQVIELRSQGLNHREIATKTGVHNSTIGRWLGEISGINPKDQMTLF